MPKADFTNKQKEEILKEVLKKTNLYYEESVQKQEDIELESVLGDELKNI